MYPEVFLFIALLNTVVMKFFSARRHRGYVNLAVQTVSMFLMSSVLYIGVRYDIQMMLLGSIISFALNSVYDQFFFIPGNEFAARRRRIRLAINFTGMGIAFVSCGLTFFTAHPAINWIGVFIGFVILETICGTRATWSAIIIGWREFLHQKESKRKLKEAGASPEMQRNLKELGNLELRFTLWHLSTYAAYVFLFLNLVVKYLV